MSTRKYTAYKDGQIVSNGTFSDEFLLKLDFPEDKYTLVLDEQHFPAPPTATYADLRRPAYPPLAEFADAMYWNNQGDPSKLEAYFAKCAAVKAQIPKPVA